MNGEEMERVRMEEKKEWMSERISQREWVSEREREGEGETKKKWAKESNS